jgi:SAM-dependent methyltransferase
MRGNVWGVQRAESVAAAMAVKSQEQLIQTRFRLDLVDGWDLRPGARVLEVGCGQGDMTAVLADAVGAGGRVLGVDNASPGYGAPVTLGQSAAYLSATPLGERIEFRFEFDVLNPASSFADGAFDDVVLSQCSWYFAGLGQLRQTLARVRPWARRLCFAEWDLAASGIGQLPHLLAVLIQGQFEAGGSRGDGNVRTPFSRQALLAILAETGWQVDGQRTVDTASLKDADWEVGNCLRLLADENRLGELPPALADLVVRATCSARSPATTGTCRCPATASPPGNGVPPADQRDLLLARGGVQRFALRMTGYSDGGSRTRHWGMSWGMRPGNDLRPWRCLKACHHPTPHANWWMNCSSSAPCRSTSRPSPR